MEKRALLLSVLVTVVFLSPSAQAISNGPGGRLYLTERLDNGTKYIRLSSIVLDANWNTVGTQVFHGDIMDNSGGSLKEDCGMSPELGGYAGAGYGTLVMGAFYNNTPLCHIPGGETMDVIRVTPHDGGSTVTLLGDGRENPQGTGIAGRDLYSTDRGFMAAPDPAGGFTGGPGSYVTTDWSFRSHLQINTDTFGDGDITDDDGDYVARTSELVGSERDFEILEKRLYWGSWWSYVHGSDGIFYHQREDNGSITRHHFYHDRGWPYPQPGGPLDVYGLGGVAVGKVQGHHAAWTNGYEADCGPWGLWYLSSFIDLNDDGDAMDNAEVTGTVDEYQIIYNNNSVTGIPGNLHQLNWLWTDFELVTNEEGDMFLLVLNSYNNWQYGRSLLVLELDDNGDFTGGNDAFKLIAYEGQEVQGNLTGFILGTEIEFDPVPEPATWCLVASGALALLRRRKRR